MRINIKKTKLMRISNNEAKQLKVSLEITVINILEQVKLLCCLGSIITNDCTCHTEIKRRIGMMERMLLQKKELKRG